MWNRVNLVKVFAIVSRSWVAFVLALGLLASFWYGCYWLVDRYAGSRIVYFKWGAIMALAVGGLSLIFNELIVIWTTGAQRVRCRDDCPELWDAVHRATPWHVRPYPRIYQVPTSGMNAFSFGWGIWGMSAVAATTGAVRHLEQPELDSVMAHEVGHIINKDILVTMAMTITVLMIGFTGWLLLRLGPYSGDNSRSSRSEGKSSWPILVVALAGLLLYVVGRLLGVILMNFVSCQREYAADATSARIMGSSRPLMSALQKITDHAYVTSSASEAAIGFLCIADPDADDFMNTHPSLDRRLRTLSALEG